MRTFVFSIFAAALVSAGPAQAQQAYKQVDEKGNVTYSQTPPVQGKEAKKVDIAPAQAGRAPGGTGSDIYRTQQPYSYYPPSQQQSQQYQQYQKAREEAEKKRQADLAAECNRNRGADCNNPETLRLMEAQKIPGGRALYPTR